MATTQNNPIIKNLLIKDASGNTQLIEVIQTAPGKFVTASGHSIKTSTTPGGAKTIIRAATTNVTPQQQTSNIQNAVMLQPMTTTVGNLVQTGQVIRTTSQMVTTSSNTILKCTPGRQIMTIPIQPAQSGSGTMTTTTLIKPANIKTEFGAPQQTTFIQQRGGQSQTLLTSPIMQQVIQAGNQRLLLTQTPNGPQLTPITSLSHHITGQQLATFVTAGPASPSGSTQTISTTNIGPTLNLSKQSFISPILDHTGARKRVDFPSDVSYESKRRKAEKGGKGLRHFSMKVCEKVRTKESENYNINSLHFVAGVVNFFCLQGVTTYNEVADELVQEFASPAMGLSSIEQQFDQKNIRRRVYDALNVLMAMNIISKEKKEIKWLGLPTNSMQECTTLEKDRQKRIERLKTKTQQLHDLIIQQVAFKSLVERNKEREKECGPPAPHASIHLPFLIVNTAKQTVIDCSISTDKMEYLFNFDGTFEIHDDIEVLKRMGLALGLDKGECTDENIAKAKQVLPKALEMYIDQIGKRDEDWRAEFGDLDFEESYFQNEDQDTLDGESSENVFEMTGNSHSGLSLSSGVDGVDGLSMSINMSVEDLEMQAAIESLHSQNTEPIDGSPQDTLGDPEEEDSYGDEDDGDVLSD